MQDILETLAIGMTIVWMLIVVLGFIVFMRYLRYKERTAIKRNGRMQEKELNYE